ncbi:hypothetical protein SNARM312S_05082 [Streptomyces narbonensis]
MASPRLPAAIRAPFEARTWRALGYVLIGLPLSVLWFSLSIAFVSAGAGLLITFLGVPILAGALAMCRGFGTVERARAKALLDLDVKAPEPVRGTDERALLLDRLRCVRQPEGRRGCLAGQAGSGVRCQAPRARPDRQDTPYVQRMRRNATFRNNPGGDRT